MASGFINTYTESGELLRRLPVDHGEVLGEKEYLRGVSCAVFVGDELAMTRRAKGRDGEGMLDFCSGHLEDGEDPLSCMRRELNEEFDIPYALSAGLQHLGSATFHVTSRQREKNWLMDIFVLRLPKWTPLALQQEEISELLLLPPKEAVRRIKLGECQFPYHPAMDGFLAKLA